MDALDVKRVWWDTEWTIPGTTWHIRGYSRSAYRTGFYVPQLGLMLDAGPQNFNKPDHILITHTHMDHIACLPMTMIGRDASDINGDHQFFIYGPAEAKQYVSDYIRAMFCVNAVSPDVPAQDWFKYFPLRARDTFRIEAKNTKLVLEVFECRHRIPTVSYGISEVKDKLRPEYVGLSGPEIVALRKTGACVTHAVMQPKLAYVCDTSIDVFALNPTLLKYPVIFIECTFIDPEELQQALTTLHIHWDHLKPYVVAHPDITFMLFHFSQRYRDLEILDFFHKACAASESCEVPIKNIRCWLQGAAVDPSVCFITNDVK
jgi:ribonuclease Z